MAELFKTVNLAFIPKRIFQVARVLRRKTFHTGQSDTGGMLWERKFLWYQYFIAGRSMEGLVVGCEICEDLWAPDSPGTGHALAGATVLVNLSASNETVGKDTYREMLVKSASAKLIAGYIYTSAGEGESTQDLVFGGHNLVAENGILLAESKRFIGETIYADLDIHRLTHERRRMTTYLPKGKENYQVITFHLEEENTKLERTFNGSRLFRQIKKNEINVVMKFYPFSPMV